MTSDTPNPRAAAAQIAREYRERGDHTGWFEAFYAHANGNTQAIPWADLKPNPGFMEWLKRESPAGCGMRAVVIGCGLGDDAEELAQYGFTVRAFDIAQTAVEWCQRRFPGSPVNYCAADLLALPAEWKYAFDFVLEIYTLQVLPQHLRAPAMTGAASLVAPGGKLLAIGRLADTPSDPTQVPSPLTPGDLAQFEREGLTVVRFEDYLDHETPPVRRFRATYRR